MVAGVVSAVKLLSGRRAFVDLDSVVGIERILAAGVVSIAGRSCLVGLNDSVIGSAVNADTRQLHRHLLHWCHQLLVGVSLTPPVPSLPGRHLCPECQLEFPSASKLTAHITGPAHSKIKGPTQSRNSVSGLRQGPESTVSEAVQQQEGPN